MLNFVLYCAQVETNSIAATDIVEFQQQQGCAEPTGDCYHRNSVQ